MTENEIAKIAVDLTFRIHKQYGPGLFESVYEEIFCFEWEETGIYYARQVGIPVLHRSLKMDLGFRADVVIDNKVIIEFKSVEELHDVHYKQLQTYLKIADIRLGLLVNFNVSLIKEGIHRVVNRL